MRSSNKPTTEAVNKAASLLASEEHQRYFFERLENPEWIVPLKERGFFDQAPAPLSTDDGGERHPHWPASRYLVRMVEHKPELVAEIFSSIETENVSVHRDMIHSMPPMPPKAAKQLVPKICEVLGSNRLYMDSDEVAATIISLADGGFPKDACKLFQAAFGNVPTIARRTEFHWYEKALKEAIPVLVRHEPLTILWELCNYLSDAIRTEEKRHRKGGDDFSWVWRPAIEENDLNPNHEVSASLVQYVRMAFEQAIESGSLSAEKCFEVLDRQQWLIFQRVKLHLIGVFATQLKSHVLEYLFDAELRVDHRFKHEYSTLVKSCWEHLTDHDRQRWLDWLEEGPDLTHFCKRIEEAEGRPPTNDEKEHRIRYWQFERLHWIRDYLSGEWKSLYDAQYEQHGKPELADTNISSGGTRWGSVSPYELGDLEGRSFEEVVHAVKTWRPEQKTFIGPSASGLARVFGEYIKNHPEVAAQAELVTGMDQVYVRTYVEALAEVIKNGSRISLKPLLGLCIWVIKQPIEGEESAAVDETDPLGHDGSWRYTRDSISRLILEVCKASIDGELMYSFAESGGLIEEIVVALSKEPADTYIVRENESEHPQAIEYLELAINSPRGKSAEAVFSFAGWVINSKDAAEPGRPRNSFSIDDVPAVLDILDWYVEPENASIASHAIIGANLGFLNFLCPQWVQANASRIFDLEVNSEYGWAAWNTFLVYGNPHHDHIELLGNQFAYAVATARSATEPDRAINSPLYGLCKHILTVYGRGQLTIEPDDGLMRRLITEAPRFLRTQAMHFVGRSLKNGGEGLPEEVTRRLAKLWEFYWEQIGRSDSAELGSHHPFGTWFASKSFSAEWLLDKLAEVTEINPNVAAMEDVVKRLSEMPEEQLAQANRVFRKILKSEDAHWQLRMWEDEVRTLLTRSLKIGDATAEAAKEVLNDLGRMGYEQYRDLMPENSDATA